MLAGAVLLAVLLAGESSSAMLASARLSCINGHIKLHQRLTVSLLLTFLLVIAPTAAGPMNPGKVAIVLVIPINVPIHNTHRYFSMFWLSLCLRFS